MTDTVELMRNRLAALAPDQVEISDESALHAGHAGAASGGGHFQLTIVSNHFGGLSTLARHRAVYDALSDLMGSRIHALSMTTLTPDEL